MKKAFLFAGTCLFAGAVFGAAAVSDVVVRQRWPWGREVDVYFTLSGATGPVSVEPKFTARGGERIPLASEALTGARFYLENGRHHLTWNPSADFYAGRTLFADVDVEFEIVSNPLYMVVDLNSYKTSTNQVEYVCAEDLRSGRWGDWEERDGTVVWTGVTNGLAYRQNKLALRYVPPTTSAEWTAAKGKSSFTLGAADGIPDADSPTDDSSGAVCSVSRCRPQGEVTLTRGYWIGVFEVTQWQWTKLGMGNPAKYRNADGTRPIESCSWRDLRGRNQAGDAKGTGANWPRNGFTVLSGTYLARLRARTGLMFDVPTEAQWEYAARAGADGLRDGELADVARFAQDADSATAVVGSYRPNAWGLYDTLGNVREITRSAWDASGYKAADFGADPKGQNLGDPYRVSRGGGWNDGAAAVNLHYREQGSWSPDFDEFSRRDGEGVRLWLPLD